MAKVVRWAAPKLQNAEKHLKPNYCLTLLCEATKPLGKRPADGLSLALGSPKAAKGAGKGALLSEAGVNIAF